MHFVRRFLEHNFVSSIQDIVFSVFCEVAGTIGITLSADTNSLTDSLVHKMIER